MSLPAIVLFFWSKQARRPSCLLPLLVTLATFSPLSSFAQSVPLPGKYVPKEGSQKTLAKVDRTADESLEELDSESEDVEDALIDTRSDADDDKSDGLIRDLAELRKQLGPQSSESVEFDLTATVTFAGEGQQVVLQDGKHRITASYDALTPDRTPPLGTLIRVRGHTHPKMWRVVIDQLESVGDGTLPEPIVIDNGQTTNDRRLVGKYCEIRGELVEIRYADGLATFLIRNNGGFHSWNIRSKKPVGFYAGLIGNRLRLIGVMLSAFGQEDARCQVALHAMNMGQLVYSKDIPPHEAMERLSGSVIGKDRNRWIGVSDGDTLTWLRSEFTDTIPLAARVEVLHDSATRVCGVIHLIEEGTFGEDETVSAVELVDLIDAPSRVIVSGAVQAAIQRPKGVEVQLEDDGIRFVAMIQDRQSEQLSQALTVGNTVRMMGVRRPFSPSYAGPSAFRLVVNDGSTVSVVTSSVESYARPFLWMLLSVAGVFGLVGTWNRLLKSKVRKRTVEAISHASKLQASCDAICEGIFFFDRQGRLTKTTGNAAIYLDDDYDNHLHASQAGYQIAANLRSPEKFLSHWQAAFASHDYTASEECSVLDGSRVFVIETMPITDVSGRYDGRLCTMKDVTEKRKLEQEVMQSQKLIAVGRLAGGIAHDFNNLLMAISANVMLTQRNADDKQAVIQHAKITEEAVSRALELTKSLLSFSRRSEVLRQVGHANDCVNQVGLLMRHMLDGNVEFSLKMAPDLWLAKIDSSQIEHVLLNLCINARDSLNQSGGRITVQTSNASHPDLGPCIKLSVQDDGCGMSKEVAALAFEPFYTTKDVGHGTGLGLSMAYGIVQQHEGEIQCESKQGEGSRFDIFLPKTNEPLPQPMITTSISVQRIKASDKAMTNAEKVSKDSGDERMRVLLIDDEPMIRDAGSALLSAIGHEVVCATGGQHALALLSDDSRFDIVLLDLTMPVMSGQETLKEIKSRYPEMRVVICTGYNVDMKLLGEDINTAPEAVLAKPFSIDDIRRVLRQSPCSN